MQNCWILSTYLRDNNPDHLEIGYLREFVHYAESEALIGPSLVKKVLWTTSSLMTNLRQTLAVENAKKKVGMVGRLP